MPLMLRSVYLLIVAIVVSVPMFFVVTPLNVVRIWYRHGKSGVAEYLMNVAVGFDQLGGSYLYNQPDYTVSTMTYILDRSGEPAALVFRKIIDFLFGKDHCRRSYEWEVEEHVKRVSELKKRV